MPTLPDNFSFTHAILFNFIIILATVSFLYFYSYVICNILAAAAAAAAAAKSLQSCPTLCDPRQQPTRLPRPWDSPGKNTGVGCHFLLQYMKVKSESKVA